MTTSKKTSLPPPPLPPKRNPKVKRAWRKKGKPDPEKAIEWRRAKKKVRYDWDEELVRNTWNWKEEELKKEPLIRENEELQKEFGNIHTKTFPILMEERQKGTIKNKRVLVLKYPYMNRSTYVTEVSCDNCNWRGTPMCPYGIGVGQRHPNGYCEQRVKWFTTLVSLFGKTNGATIIQREKMIENLNHETLWTQKLMQEGVTELPRDLLDLKRLNMQSIEKYRKQEEGSKLKVENTAITPNMINNLIGRQIEKSIEEKEETEKAWTTIKTHTPEA
jgi:hypothetical protein